MNINVPADPKKPRKLAVVRSAGTPAPAILRPKVYDRHGNATEIMSSGGKEWIA